MSSLPSALEEYVSDDVAGLADGQLAEDLGELEGSTRVIEVECARRVAEIERWCAHLRDGHVSIASWLARRIGIPSWLATRHVRLARALPGMPRTSAALAEGTISIPAAEQLVFSQERRLGCVRPMRVDAGRLGSAPLGSRPEPCDRAMAIPRGRGRGRGRICSPVRTSRPLRLADA